jgi:hypothetical protein
MPKMKQEITCPKLIALFEKLKVRWAEIAGIVPK